MKPTRMACLLPFLVSLHLAGPLLAVANAAEPRVVRGTGGFGLVDPETEAILVPPAYEELSRLAPGRYRAKVGGRWGVVTSDGDVVVEFRYDGIHRVEGGYLVSENAGGGDAGTEKPGGGGAPGGKGVGRLGFADPEGNLLVPPVHERLSVLFAPGRLFVVGKAVDPAGDSPRFLYGIVNGRNEILLPIEYDSLEAPSRSGVTGGKLAVEAFRGEKRERLEVPVEFESGPRIVRERGLVGLAAKETGEILLAPKFEELLPLGKDRYGARSRGLWGVVTSSGETVIECRYAAVTRAGRWYVLSEDVLSDAPADGAPNRSAKLPRSVGRTVRGKRYGLADAEGNVLIVPSFDTLALFHRRGLFLVGDVVERAGERVRYRYGIVNGRNERVVPIEYDSLAVVQEREDGGGRATVEGRRGGSTEHLVVPLGPKEGGDGKRRMGDPPLRFREGGKYGFRSHLGRVVVEPRFEDAWEFREGLARVKLGGRWGFLDEEGRVVVEPQFDYAWDFSGGRAKVRLPDGTVRHVDREGKLVE